MQQVELYGHPKWLFVSIFGKNYVQENSHKTLEDFFDEAPHFYYIYFCPNTVCLGSYPDYYTQTKKIIIKKISNMRAYQIFGIERMEDAIEKTISVMSKAEYRSKIISEI